MAKPKIWMGLSTVGILLTVLMVAGSQIAETNAGLINDYFGLNQTKVEKTGNGEVDGSAYTEEDGSLSNDSWKRMIKDSYKFCEEAVEQGSVLLKNIVKNGKPVLPLAKEERKISLLGRGSKNLFMRSGAGGAAPNEKFVQKLDAAFENCGFEINRAIFDKYSTLTLSQMTTPSTQVEDSARVDMSAVGDYTDAAIVTFVRIGTENTDPSAGTLDLKAAERQLLVDIKESGLFEKTIVLINSPMPMSVDWVDDEDLGVDACIWMGVPGYYGVPGIVHVLMGEDAEGNPINPSGHCPDTFAASASSSAAYVNFGNSQVVVYKEGVYVGYKYYETRYEDIVLGQGHADCDKGIFKSTGGSWDYAEEMGYPFGYGLSYTTFNEKILSVNYNDETDQYDVEVEVENTGDVDGKASVQVYVQQPYTLFDQANGLGKSSIALMGYDKVDVKAGEKVKTTVSFDKYFLCTYDNKINKTFIIEDGTYYFAVGNGAHEALNNIIGYKEPSASLVDHLGESYDANLDAVKEVEIEEDLETYKKSHYSDVEVTNQFDDADYNWYVEKNGGTAITYLDRQDWESTYPTTTTQSPAVSADTDMRQYYKKADDAESYKDADGIEYNVPYINADGEEEKITFSDMSLVPLEGEVTEGRFKGELGEDVWDAFIKQMDLDDLCISVSDNRGILDVKKVLKKGNSVAEGPEGLLSKYQYGDKRWATGFPTGPVYTATFDHAMQKKFGGFYGEDAIYCGVASVNAPGANINRTPYGSRASEYMSEDGVLNYNVAANIVGAARRKGLIMNIKHCFLNNQETGRQGVQTYCNEQAIREIYLRPFEGALTKGNGLGIMTSYNRIGARYAACHEPLMLKVMRGEWNYKGFIIDDALTGSNDSNYSNGPAMLTCGTDLFCLDGNRGNQLKQLINSASNDDLALLKCLQRANKNIMYSISRSWMGGISFSEEEIIQAMNPWWKSLVKGLVIGTGSVTGVLFGIYVFTEVFSKRRVA